ncbi:uncharacterized protein VTP21DRAFT_11495 [Calcarisporiella thermophila]|uniref:uncharacterized protein n=1 Tax=Calcarisporiella thermophila TaxID=911321 RepID=UPI0037441BE8
MRAILVDRYLKSPEELVITENAPEPDALKPGQVLVQVVAVGLNFYEVLMIQGKYQTKPKFPFLLGTEFAGIVLKVNDGQNPGKYGRVKVGDRVFGSAAGTHCEKIVCNMKEVLRIPPGLSFEEAAGVFMNYMTSWYGLVNRGSIQPGEVVLVHGAAGGVGLTAVQIAKAHNAKVIAMASTEAKRKVCLEQGADHVIGYEKGWHDKVKQLTGGRGVDIVYDPVGLLLPSLKCVAPHSRLLVIGFAGGKIESIPANLCLVKSASVVGVFFGNFSARNPDKAERMLADILGAFESGRLKRPVIYKVYKGLEGVKEGLLAIMNREVYGKAVVRIAMGNRL